MAFGAASMAADLPKEGKYKGTASGYGTSKSIPVGKERVLTIWDENNLTLTDGFSDHMAWRWDGGFHPGRRTGPGLLRGDRHCWRSSHSNCDHEAPL
jgi:hypothetical protein